MLNQAVLRRKPMVLVFTFVLVLKVKSMEKHKESSKKFKILYKSSNWTYDPKYGVVGLTHDMQV